MRESVIEREQRVCARYANKRNEQPALAFSGNELVPHLFQRQHVIAMHQAAPPPSVSTIIHSMRMRMREHTYAYEERHRNAPSCSASFSQYTSTYLAVTGTYVATHLLIRHCPLQSAPHGGLPIMRATPPFALCIVQFGISTYDERFS